MLCFFTFPIAMLNIITILLLVGLGAYIIEFTVFIIGLHKASLAPIDRSFEPTISIIVAARNEEKRIKQCLRSLTRLDYPREKLEIIIVNDRSSDGTPAIVNEFVARFPYVKMITTGHEPGNLRGKMNAVALGIQASHGEILMLTDADCIVPPTWIRGTVQYFTEGIGIVGGFTILTAKRPFEGLQALDWVLLFNIASSTAGLGFPLTVVGNNLSLRRSAYDQTGGYEKIPFSVTEDYALVQAVLQETEYKVRYPLQLKTAVESTPCADWDELFRQRQRWAVGGLEMITPGILVMSVCWSLHLLLLVGLFFVSPTIWLLAVGAKVAMDVCYFWKSLTTLKISHLLRYLLAFELYYLPYAIVTPFVALLSKKVVWKERSLGTGGIG